MYCDLHTHSVFSDGSFTPAQLISHAKELNLTIALTDHNTVSGLPEFMAEAEKQGVTAVPGIEYSTQCRGRELHLVGLFVAPEYYARLEQVAVEFRQLKTRSNQEMIARLADAGYPLDYEALRAKSPGGNINRAHIAGAMLEKGYVRSVQDAFERFLGEDRPFYVRTRHLETAEAIRLLKEIGAVSVLAHPLKDLTEPQLRQILPELIDAGLDAMETHHSSYDDETIALAAQIVREFGLLPGGGSDFHGLAKPDIQLGTGKGNLRIPISFYENLRTKCKE